MLVGIVSSAEKRLRFSQAKWLSWTGILIPVRDFSSASTAGPISSSPSVWIQNELIEDRETPLRNVPLQVEDSQSLYIEHC